MGNTITINLNIGPDGVTVDTPVNPAASPPKADPLHQVMVDEVEPAPVVNPVEPPNVVEEFEESAPKPAVDNVLRGEPVAALDPPTADLQDPWGYLREQIRSMRGRGLCGSDVGIKPGKVDNSHDFAVECGPWVLKATVLGNGDADPVYTIDTCWIEYTGSYEMLSQREWGESYNTRDTFNAEQHTGLKALECCRTIIVLWVKSTRLALLTVTKHQNIYKQRSHNTPYSNEIDAFYEKMGSLTEARDWLERIANWIPEPLIGRDDRYRVTQPIPNTTYN